MGRRGLVGGGHGDERWLIDDGVVGGVGGRRGGEERGGGKREGEGRSGEERGGEERVWEILT